MIKDILRGDLVTVEPGTHITECARLMAEKNVGSVLVLGVGDRPRGIITDRDIVLRCVATHTDVDDTTIENILSESLVVVQETDDLFDCIRKMHQAKVRRVPVVNSSGRAVGIVSFDDILQVLSQEFSELSDLANVDQIVRRRVSPPSAA